MHIAIFFPGKLPVKKYGGTERVVIWLAQGLRALGHEVTLIAGRGTAIEECGVVEIDTKLGNRHDFDINPFLPNDADVVHYFVPIHRAPTVPHLWTMEGNARQGFDPGKKCVFVSNDHASRHGGGVFVYNGINLDEYTLSTEKSDSLLFLGRLSSVKGWKAAIRIARAAGRTLILAGGWRPSFTRATKFLGEIGGQEKTELLASSKAMLMPIDWHEPFGIVIAEALASGTPVIGRPMGSLPELIPESVGGLSLDEDQLVEWARNPPWKPEDCRKHAENHFGHIKMAESYLGLYKRMLETGAYSPSSKPLPLPRPRFPFS